MKNKTVLLIIFFIFFSYFFIWQKKNSLFKKNIKNIVQSNIKSSSPSISKKNTKKNLAAPGRQEYSIIQNHNSPEFYKAIIDPEDVKLGEKQTMTVYVKDKKAEIIEVKAEIKTDTKIQIYNLSLISGSRKDGVWQGSWTVNDTHNKEYVTKFIAKNKFNEKSEVYLSWTDPGTGCGGIDCTISSGAITISGVDGADGGTLYITGGSITVPSGATLIAGALSITGTGALAINSGGVLHIQNGNYICMTDADADGYPANTNQIAYCTSGRRRYLMASISTTDCYEANANARPGSTYCGTTHRGDGSFDYNCNGANNYCGNAVYSSSTCGAYVCRSSFRGCQRNWMTNNPCIGAQVGCGSSGYLAGPVVNNCKTCSSGEDCYCVEWGVPAYTSLGGSGTQGCN